MNNATAVPEITSLDDVTTLVNMMFFRAVHTPDKEACLFEGNSLTFAALWDSVKRVAGFLQQHGVEAQDRVLLVMPNGLEFFPSFYGVQRAGAVAVPLFPGSGPERIM